MEGGRGYSPMGLAALPVNNPPRYPTNTPEPITWKIIQRKNECDREGLFHCPICQVTLPLGPLCKHWVLSALKNSGYGNREARPLPGHLRSITYTYMMTPDPSHTLRLMTREMLPSRTTEDNERCSQTIRMSYPLGRAGCVMHLRI